jgi:hypothetical protein
MATHAYPFILKEHYEDLRKLLLPELPESYEKWLADVKSKKEMDCLRYTTPTSGSLFQAYDIIVDGGNFKTYCDRKREKPSLRWLYEFVNDPEWQSKSTENQGGSGQGY